MSALLFGWISMNLESEHNLPFNRWFKYRHGHRQLAEQQAALATAKLEWNQAMEELAIHFDSLGFEDTFTPDGVADMLRRMRTMRTDHDPC